MFNRQALFGWSRMFIVQRADRKKKISQAHKRLADANRVKSWPINIWLLTEPTSYATASDSALASALAPKA
jgi:hypothetical protein